MDTCGSKFCAIYRPVENGTEYAVVKIRCKSWACRPCRSKKVELYKKIITECFGDVQLYMYTFTYYHSRSEEETWDNYNMSWNRFRTAAAKKYGSIKYVKVLECHKSSNYPHIHVICDTYLSPLWLGAEAARAGFGWSNKWQRFDKRGAAQYVAKYLTKDWPRADSARIRWQKKLRIVTMSQGLVDKIIKIARWWVIASYVPIKLAIQKIQRIVSDEYIYNDRIIEYDGQSEYQCWTTEDWPAWLKNQCTIPVKISGQDTYTNNENLTLFDARD